MTGTHTALSALIPATLLWTIILTFPLLLWYIDSAYFRIFVYMLYPVAVGMISRTGTFWVSMDKIAMISILTFTFGFLLLLNKGNKEALKKPKEHKLRSALLFSILTILFIAMLYVFGTQTYLYNPLNFKTT
jgi:membrane-anchored protein YejM (alkaline phosphatase superfamily)